MHLDSNPAPSLAGPTGLACETNQLSRLKNRNYVRDLYAECTAGLNGRAGSDLEEVDNEPGCKCQMY